MSILLMVGYHLLFDLGEFRGLKSFLGFSTDLASPAWTAAQLFFATVFVVLSGISSTLSRSNVRRGLKLLAVAAAVTLVTWFFEPSAAVFFGILHCLAVSILIYGAVFERKGAVACAFAGGIILGLAMALPALRRALAVDFDWLLPLGLFSPRFSSYDYFPLIPWLGVFLVGSSLGKWVYARRRSLLPWAPRTAFVNFAGRHSLLIYIAHQPIILGVLYLLR